MSPRRLDTPAVPVEIFIQALMGQLDRAQSAMTIKARLRKLPLTFAVKDVALELRAFVEVVDSVVHVRPAGPGETDASVLHLTLTTITKPMIEENSIQPSPEPEAPSIKEALGDEISENEQRRLEWIGVNTVDELRRLHAQSGEREIQRVAQVPAERLQAALARSSMPFVRETVREPRTIRVSNGDDVQESTTVEPSRQLRIRGYNLLRNGPPRVHIGGERVPVISATGREVVVAPRDHQWSGTLELETEPGMAITTELRLKEASSVDSEEAQ